MLVLDENEWKVNFVVISFVSIAEIYIRDVIPCSQSWDQKLRSRSKIAWTRFLSRSMSSLGLGITLSLGFGLLLVSYRGKSHLSFEVSSCCS